MWIQVQRHETNKEKKTSEQILALLIKLRDERLWLHNVSETVDCESSVNGNDLSGDVRGSGKTEESNQRRDFLWLSKSPKWGPVNNSVHKIFLPK